MRVLLRGLLIAGAVLFAGWLAICGFLLWQRFALIYPFSDWPRAENVSGIPAASVQRLRAHDGVELLVWTVPPRRDRPVIRYFTGNTGSLPATAPKLREFTMAGFGLVAMNYRGAAGSEGAPDQDDIISDGLAVYDSIAELSGHEDEPPIIYGSSLGAAVAAQIAAQRPAQAVLLEVPFARLCEAAQARYPFVPACWILPDQRWETQDIIQNINAPLLIQHGTDDEVIPYAQGKKLYDAASEPKELMTYPGGNHSDLRLHGAGLDAIAFFSQLSQ